MRYFAFVLAALYAANVQAGITAFSGVACDGSAGLNVPCDGSCHSFEGRHSFQVRKTPLSLRYSAHNAILRRSTLALAPTVSRCSRPPDAPQAGPSIPSPARTGSARTLTLAPTSGPLSASRVNSAKLSLQAQWYVATPDLICFTCLISICFHARRQFGAFYLVMLEAVLNSLSASRCCTSAIA